MLVLHRRHLRHLGGEGRLLRRIVRYRGPQGVVTCAVEELPVAPLDEDTLELPPPYQLLLPVEPPEVWCAGVTYERSRDARIEESQEKDVYARVYEAERPELFLKDACCRRTVGPGRPIRVRSDSPWNVPEPEVAVILGEGGAITGLTIGNDVSSRSIEGENPLYLPQAKIYAGACALGPALLVDDDWERPRTVAMRILDGDGSLLFEGETSTARMRRSYRELLDWLLRDNPVPPGSALLTGTGLVPPHDFTLRPGHIVEIHVPGIGTLRNPVAGHDRATAGGKEHER